MSEHKRVWQQEAKSLLQSGLGSEDIAVILDRPRSEIQWLIECMRDSGMLKQMFPNARPVSEVFK